MAKKEEKDIAEPLPVEVVEAPIVMSFDRYFLTLGRPQHHKRGMAAFVKSVKGKKTQQAWELLFKGY